MPRILEGNYPCVKGITTEVCCSYRKPLALAPSLPPAPFQPPRYLEFHFLSHT